MDDLQRQLTDMGERLSAVEEAQSSQATSKSTQDDTGTSSSQAYSFSYPLDPNQRKIIEKLFLFQESIVLAGSSAATSSNYGAFFIANRTYTVMSVVESHATAGSDASAVTLQVEKLTGTTAAGSGTNLLATAINLKGTANTVVTPPLVTSGVLNLRVGDRLSLAPTGTLTSLAHVVVTVYLQYV